jgi:GxxExxY protein
VIGACIEVHRHLGPGLLESAYEHCVAHELGVLGLRFERQRPVPLEYKGTKLECGYRLDLVVEDSLVVEIKCVDRLLPIHNAQVITYLRLTKLQTGLLLNFHETVLKNGLRRLVLSADFASSASSCGSLQAARFLAGLAERSTRAPNMLGGCASPREFEQEDAKTRRFGDCSEAVIGACIEVHRVDRLLPIHNFASSCLPVDLIPVSTCSGL